jgi:hypothetical protein
LTPIIGTLSKIYSDTSDNENRFEEPQHDDSFKMENHSRCDRFDVEIEEKPPQQETKKPPQRGYGNSY